MFMMLRSLGRLLALVGLIACVLVTSYIWQVTAAQQPMWLLPGAYLLELIGLSIVAAIATLFGESRLTWVVTGAYLGFVVLGAFSVGFAYLPIVALFAMAAILTDVQQRRNIAVNLFIAVLAAVAQNAVMVFVINVLYP